MYFHHIQLSFLFKSSGVPFHIPRSLSNLYPMPLLEFNYYYIYLYIAYESS